MFVALSVIMSALAELSVNSAWYATVWAAMHIICRATSPNGLDQPKRAYWASSMVSSVHGVYVSWLAWRAMAEGEYWSSEDLSRRTPGALDCCHVYLGYLVADLIPLIYYYNEWSGTSLYLVHHMLSVCSWGMMAIHGQLLGLASGLLLLEATAPFTNGRWFLAELKRTSGPLYLVTGGCMALSFFLLRVLLMGYFFVRYVIVLRNSFFALPPAIYLTILLSYAFGYPLQLFWFRKIVLGLLKALGLVARSAKPKLAKC